jgi:hypothetical protein
MKFYSAKGKLIPIVMLLFFMMSIWLTIQQAWPAVVIFVLLGCLFLWIWFDTYYIIKDDKVCYKSAFIQGSISISIINGIEKNKGLYSGAIKPALSTKGLILKYNRYDDMYISPEKETEFIAELQKINPAIKLS